MKEEESSNSSGTSVIELFLELAISWMCSIELSLNLASLVAGAYHGYYDAQGILFEKDNLEWGLTYGPAIVQGGLGATIGGIVGAVGGGALGVRSGCRYSTLEKIAKGTGGTVIGTVAGAGLGGAIGGINGAVQTLIGYSVGYFAGYATK